jgi:hypothetical protein
MREGAPLNPDYVPALGIDLCAEVSNCFSQNPPEKVGTLSRSQSGAETPDPVPTSPGPPNTRPSLETHLNPGRTSPVLRIATPGERIGNVYSETMPTNVITYWAISEGVTLQGVKDPRGTTGIHATPKRERRCSHPPLGGLTK